MLERVNYVEAKAELFHIIVFLLPQDEAQWYNLLKLPILMDK